MPTTIELSFALQVEGDQVTPPEDMAEGRRWLADVLRSAAEAVEAGRIARINVNVIPSK